MFERAIQSQIAYPPSCCDNHPKVRLEYVEHILGEKLVQAYKSKEREYKGKDFDELGAAV